MRLMLIGKIDSEPIARHFPNQQKLSEGNDIAQKMGRATSDSAGHQAAESVW